MQSHSFEYIHSVTEVEEFFIRHFQCSDITTNRVVLIMHGPVHVPHALKSVDVKMATVSKETSHEICIKAPTVTHVVIKLSSKSDITSSEVALFLWITRIRRLS